MSPPPVSKGPPVIATLGGFKFHNSSRGAETWVGNYLPTSDLRIELEAVDNRGAAFAQ